MRRQVKPPLGLIAAIVVGLAGAAALYGIARLTHGTDRSEQVVPGQDGASGGSPD